MADLNHDGRVDIQDAKYLYDEIERMLAAQGAGALPGRHGLLSRPTPRIRRSCTSTSAAPRRAGKARERWKSKSRRENGRRRSPCAAARAGARGARLLGAGARSQHRRAVGDQPAAAAGAPLSARHARRADAGARLRLRRRGDSGSRLLPVRQPLLQQPAALRAHRRLRRGAAARGARRQRVRLRARRARALHRRQHRPSRGGEPRGRADVSRSCARSSATSVTYADAPANHVHGRVLVRRRAGGERRLRLGHVSELHRLSGREAGARARVPRRPTA